MGKAPDERRHSTGLGITRRQALAGIGGLGALGVTGMAATSDDDLSVPVERFQWTAQRRRKFAKPFNAIYDVEIDGEETQRKELVYDEPLVSVDETVSLNYMGVRWDEYGNPAGGAEMEGAWQHTFLLSNFAMAQQMTEESFSSDGEARVVESYPVTYEPHDEYVSVPKLKVEATGDTDGVAISPLRDKDRFGIINPGTFESDVRADSEGAEEFRSFADQIVKNRNEYQPNMGSLRYAMATEADVEQDAAAMVSLGKTFLSMSKYLEAPIKALDGLYDVYAGFTDLTDEPEQPEQHVPFFRGFEQRYPGDDFYAGPYCGEFVTFHVYVAPNETGQIEVESLMDYKGGRDPSDNKRYNEQPPFESIVDWTVEFDALAPPSESDPALVEQYNAQITDFNERKPIQSDDFNWPSSDQSPVDESATLQEYERSKAPNPSITPDPSNPSTISDGTELAFDAFDTTVVDGNVVDYSWSVHYTSQPDQHADQYVDYIREESYGPPGNFAEYEFTVDVPEDPEYTDVHEVVLEVTTRKEDTGEERTAQDRYRFSTTDLGEPEFTVDVEGEPVEGGDLTFSASVSSTPTSVASIEWEVTEYGHYRPGTAPNVTGTGETFTYTPPSDGFYTIEATVYDTLGPQNTESVDVNVEALDAAAEITSPSSNSLTAGKSYDFYLDYSGLPNVDTDAITWEFGDEATDTGEYASHTFSEDVGGETVTVTATVPSTSHDVEAVATRDYEVEIDDDMSVTLSGPDELVEGTTGRVEATASGYESNTVTYGFSNTDPIPIADPHQHYRDVTYDESGTQTVTVTAAEDGDNFERAEDSIDIEVKPFFVDIAGPSDPKEDDYVYYDAIVEGDDSGLSYEWTAYDAAGDELPDAIRSGGTSAGVEFADSGAKTLEVVASGDEWTDDATFDVSVEADGDMTVELEGPDSLYLGETGRVEATASGYESDTVTYGFSNTDPIPIADPHQHYRDVTYDEPGTEVVSVTAAEDGDNGERATDEIEIDVERRELTVEIQGDDTVKSNTSEEYQASVSNAVGSVSYDWNVSASGDSADVSFDDCGTRTITVTVEESAGPGRTASDTLEVSVTDCDMSVDLEGPSKLYVDQTGTVEASVSGAEADLNYGFDNADAVDSSQRDSPTRPVTFDSPGTKTVSVTAHEIGDNNERAEDSITIDVEYRPFDVDLSGPSSAKSSTSETYEADVTNAESSVSYDWNVSASGSTADVSFGSCGYETIRVTAEENYGPERTASDSITVDVYDCDMSASLSGPSELEVGETGTVEAFVSGAESSLNYGFENADSVNSGQRDSPTRPVTFHSTGTETVSVTAFETGDNGEQASASHDIDVVAPPDPEVSIGTPTTPIACSGSYEVSASVSDAETPVSYDWTLDGRSIGTGQTVEFTVSTNGEKTLRVEIEDANGNTASATKTFYACASTGGY